MSSLAPLAVTKAMSWSGDGTATDQRLHSCGNPAPAPCHELEQCRLKASLRAGSRRFWLLGSPDRRLRTRPSIRCLPINPHPYRSRWLLAAARTRTSKRVTAETPSTPARSTTNPAAPTTSSAATTTRRVLKWPPPTPTAARGRLQPAGLTSSPALAATAA